MGAMIAGNEIARERLRLVLLAYGIDHAYRVVRLDEVVHSISYATKEAIKRELDLLAEEGLVTRLVGRYCFNRGIPAQLCRLVKDRVTPSGTVRIKRLS